MRKVITLLCAMIFMIFVSSVALATTIGAPGGGLIQSWGKTPSVPNTQTYGQTITTPTDNILTSFSFWLGPTSTNYPIPQLPSLDFQAYVYAWNETLGHAVGSALFASAVMNYSTTPLTPFSEYTFNTGGISLNTGDMYVLFLSTSGLTGDGHVQWEGSPGDVYTGGSFVFLNNAEDKAQWTTTVWASTFYGNGDAHFSATFASAVPEPATLLLLGTGLIGLAGFRKRFRN